MSKIGAIWRRELASYFVSPVAYVILFAFLFIQGIAFYVYAKLFNGAIPSIVRFLFQYLIFWLLLLLIPPVLTMRLFAEERRSGTFEALLAAPVRPVQVVLGKFLAAWTFQTILWLHLLIYIGMLSIFGDPEWGVVISSYLGIAGFGAVLVAIGVFASAWTRSQVIAAIGALGGNMLLFLLSFLPMLYPPTHPDRAFLEFVSPLNHFQWDFSRGMVDLRYFVLYAVLAGLLLLGAVRVVGERR
ncbi:MAG: ABC transporter permease [Planctomycetes bacterium]|nr:ABC transporter permease [Planctomycetota bacterium]